MFDTAPVLWLQEWTSPALTKVMLAVSAWGYVPSCLAVAIVCGFGWRLRLGVTLILAIVVADAMTAIAKDAFASPRPHAVDARVRTPRVFESGVPLIATGTSLPADDFGFPSGHVAATAAWALGLAWSRRRPWQIAAGTWVALMALSRMYLGRHFPFDVVGGLVVGVAGLAIAHLVFPPVARGSGTRSSEARTALGVLLLVFLVVAALSAWFGTGFGGHDAGRFCGLVVAAFWLTRTGAFDESIRPAMRMARVAGALALLWVSLWSSTWTIPLGLGLVMGTMTVSTALHASVLLVPALVFRGNRF